MALSASGLFVPTFELILANTIAVDLTSDTNIKVALLDNSTTPAFDTHDYWADLVSGHVTGTGWAAPVALTGTDFALSSGGTLAYNATDVSETGTTLASVYGCVLFDDSVTTPTADPMICLVYFGGSSYDTTAGTFAIQWDAAGIFTIDLTP